MDDQEEMEDEYVNRNYKQTDNAMNDDGDEFEENPQDLLAAAGLEDSDAEADAVIFSPFLSLSLYIHT